MRRLNQSSSNSKNQIKYHGNTIIFDYAKVLKHIQHNILQKKINEYSTPDTAANLLCRNCSFL